ncbi:hypothetical protein CHS0354_031644 [Potamilus streckersoni]|uniref:Tudor domain-containing protein n=1 Tax=Potamilus streckersoni TaxID=2493646 RepID=A0AAE0SGC6_9BIVA|nr:hypothetical protein CHS0354_031644 [Potamilus streckersoni]
MPNLRVILSYAVPAVTALIGILWIFRRKGPGTRKAVEPPERHCDSETPVKNDVRQGSRDVSNSRDKDLGVEDSEDWLSSQQCKSPWQESMSPWQESPCVTTDPSEKDTDGQVESPILEESTKLMHSTKPFNISIDVQGQNVSEMDSSFSTNIVSNSDIVGMKMTIESSPKTVSMPEAYVQKVEPPYQSVRVHFQNFKSSSPAPDVTESEELCSMLNLKDTELFAEPIDMDTESRKIVVMDTESREPVVMNTAMFDLNSVPISAEVEKEIIAKIDQLNMSSFIADEQENEADTSVIDLTDEKDSNINRSIVDLTKDSYIDLTNDDSRTECSVPFDSSIDCQTIRDNTSNNQSLEAISSFDSRIEDLSNGDITQIDDLSSVDITQQPDHKQKHFILSSENSPCDNTSEASNDSGKGASVTESASLPKVDEERVYEFSIPSEYCGLLIGSKGKTIKTIKEQSGARIQLRNNPFTPGFQICVIEGPQSSVENALHIIQRRFPPVKFPGLDLRPINQEPVVQPQPNTVLMPEIMQLTLPEGVSLDIVVSSIVDAGHIFVQQPTHPTFPSLDRLNQFMLACYSQPGAVPDLPQPIEVGVICAAPMLNGWYRAQIMAVCEEMNECDVKYVDYGGYSRIQSSMLKQIRSDFMTLPFQAVECYMANVTPLQNENYFSPEAAAVLEELTQRKLLQAQVCGRSDDGIPYIHIYQINGHKAVFVNRELVNHGVTRWIEILS